MSLFYRLWGVIGMGTLVAVSTVGAQERTTLHLGANAPVLGPHRFSPISTLKHPFMKSFVRSTLGMGQANDVDLGTVVVGNDTLVDFQGDLLFLQLQFEYQHAVKDWIAARVEVDVLGRLGTDLEALVADGVRTSLGYELGWLLRLVRTDRVILVGDLFLTNQSFTTVDLQGFVDDILSGTPASLVRSSPSVRGGGGLRLGWGISRLFGLSAVSELAYGESPLQGQANQWTYGSGVTADFDLNAVTPVPLGISFGGRIDRYPRIGDNTSDALISSALTVAYNGHRDFLIGIESRVERFRLTKGSPATVFGKSIAFTTQYFF
ncbi:MAG: hypothetical protein V3T56_07960 [Gemmatimonadales bacterium]